LFARIKGLDPTKYGILFPNIQAECATMATLLDDPTRIAPQFLKRSPPGDRRVVCLRTRNVSNL